MPRAVRVKPISYHRDILDTFNRHNVLASQFAALHKLLKGRHPFIARIAVVVYDFQTDLLKTYVDSGKPAHPLRRYSAKLADVASLQDIVARGAPRVVNDLDIFKFSRAEHATRIRNAEYGVSYTLPMFLNNAFFGVVFFNSRLKHVFTDRVLHDLDIFGHLASLTAISKLSSIRTLEASIRTAADIIHHNDVGIGAHLDRTANFTRLIARRITVSCNVTDDLIERFFLFAPSHAIETLATPDTFCARPALRSTSTASRRSSRSVRKSKRFRLASRKIPTVDLANRQTVADAACTCSN